MEQSIRFAVKCKENPCSDLEFSFSTLQDAKMAVSLTVSALDYINSHNASPDVWVEMISLFNGKTTRRRIDSG